MKTFLRNDVPILSGLSDDDIELLARTAVERHFPEGRHIVRRGDPGESAFILKQGMAETLLEKPGGASVHLSSIGPGELFGELSLFDGEPRSASVVATEDTIAIEIRRALFLKEIARNPETSMKLMSAVAKRLRRSESIVSNFADRIYGDVMPRLESTVSAQLEAAKVICRESKERVDMTAAHAEQLLKSTTAQAESVLASSGAQAESVLRDIKDKWSSVKIIGALIGTIFAGVVSMAGFFGFESYKDVVEKKQEIEKINSDAAELVNRIKKESDYLKVLKETRLAFENMRRDLQLDKSPAAVPGDLQQESRISRDFFLALDKLFDYLSQPGKQNSDILVEALGLVEETIDRDFVVMIESDWYKIIDAIVQSVKAPPEHWRQQQRLDYLVVKLHDRMTYSYSEGARILVQKLEKLMQGKSELEPAAAERTALILARLGSDDAQVKAELKRMQASASPWLRSQAAVARITLGEEAGWDALRKDLAGGVGSGNGESSGYDVNAAFPAALMIADRSANPLERLDQRHRFSVDELSRQLSADRLESHVSPWPTESGLRLIEKIVFEKITQDPGSWKNRFSWQYACHLICSLDCESSQERQGKDWCGACYEQLPRQFNRVGEAPPQPGERCSVARG